MNVQTYSRDRHPEALDKLVEAAARQIPPLWPLDAQVTVNPYLGQSGRRLAETAALLERIGGGPVTMPRAWYLDRIADGRITGADLADALAASPYPGKPATLEGLRQAAARPRPASRRLPTVADLAAAASGVDWPDIIADRLGLWAAGHFDAGQAPWVASRARGAWPAYREFAMHDLTPEILGLHGFAAFAADAPATPLEAIACCVRQLGLGEAALPTYCHQLLLSLAGWGQYARHLLWRAELSGRSDATPAAMLAIRMLWEAALYRQHRTAVDRRWSEVREQHASPAIPDEADVVDEILQEAAERAGQRDLARSLAAPSRDDGGDRPLLQAAFCIDVRSEVFRRALESVHPGIRTLGFAGFFGVAARHRGFASDVEELRLPVLLQPAVGSCSTAPGDRKADLNARLRARARRAWGRFKMAAVSSFAFVEAMGPVYGARLLRDGLGRRPASRRTGPKPRFEPPLDAPEQAKIAETVLRAMSLTGSFARIVLLAGHGASVANNPHASGLHCGACGGHSGEVNARLLAGLLNDRGVRARLAARGIGVPADTLFVAALHDTTTDAVTLYAGDVDARAHAADLDRVRDWLAAAGTLARAERARRLPGAGAGEGIRGRAGDWAELRPEWGLAGCRAFVAAPRCRTVGRDLAGRAFLHDYDWRQDAERGFPVLELIMTAPVVVASWISLQYYGSTVAPQVFGAGNKLLHNVVGGIGVAEGNGGLIRSGLPWQSVHDGGRLVHEPLRLSVCIEAPREAMTAILGRHDGVRALFDNGWLHLFALDEAVGMTWRYAGNLAWLPVERPRQPAPSAACMVPV